MRYQSPKKKDLQEVDGEIQAVLQRKGEPRVWGAERAVKEASLVPAVVLGGLLCAVREKTLQCLTVSVYLNIIKCSAELLLNH